MSIVIIKYNAGNIMSVDYALQRLGINAVLTDDPEIISSADKVIFPGVGEASSAMKYLRERNLDKVIKNLKQPVLGICIGLQLLCSWSEEGNTECIGVFEEKVIKFKIPEKSPEIFKIPHIGWNNINLIKGNLFDSYLENKYVYFVHSYFATIGEHTSAITDYAQKFSAALEKDNFCATQFHPEKSGPIGAKILENFLNKY